MRSVRERQCSKKVGFHCDVVWLTTFVGITGGSSESKFNPALCLDELIVVVWLGSLIASCTFDSTNLSLVLPSCNLVGGLNPSKKYARQIGNRPQIGVKIKKCLSCHHLVTLHSQSFLQIPW